MDSEVIGATTPYTYRLTLEILNAYGQPILTYGDLGTRNGQSKMEPLPRNQTQLDAAVFQAGDRLRTTLKRWLPGA